MRVKILDYEGYECKVQSSSDPSTWYEVNLETNECSCPHWVYRCSKTGKPCKHMREALKAVEKKFAERLGPSGGEPTDTPRQDAAAQEQIPDDPFDSVWGSNDGEVPF